MGINFVSEKRFAEVDKEYDVLVRRLVKEDLSSEEFIEQHNSFYNKFRDVAAFCAEKVSHLKQMLYDYTRPSEDIERVLEHEAEHGKGFIKHNLLPTYFIVAFDEKDKTFDGYFITFGKLYNGLKRKEILKILKDVLNVSVPSAGDQNLIDILNCQSRAVT